MSTKVIVEERVSRFRAIGLDEVAMEQSPRLFAQKDLTGDQSLLE